MRIASERDMILGTERKSQREALYRDTSRILAYVLTSGEHRDMFPDPRLNPQPEEALHIVDQIKE